MSKNMPMNLQFFAEPGGDPPANNPPANNPDPQNPPANNQPPTLTMTNSLS